MTKRKAPHLHKPKGRKKKNIMPWLEALDTVLEERKIIWLTDEELVLLVNLELKKRGLEESQISYKTFKRWKAGDYNKDPIAQQFLERLQLAYIQMKDVVGERLMTDQNFTRWAWILERKFAGEFSLVQRHETTHKTETTIQITAGNKENLALLDSIINGDIIDVKFTEVEPQKLKSGLTDNKADDEIGF